MKYNTEVKLLKSGQTVFSTQDLAILWAISDTNYLKTKIYRLTNSGTLKRIRRGIYALDKDYNRFELANKLVSPSYVSLQTVLAQKGVLFQYDSTIYSIAGRSIQASIREQTFVYKKIKDDIMLVRQGTEVENGVTMATLERAILDMLYLEKDCYFDNPNSVDWDKCFSLAKMYNNTKLNQRLTKLYEAYNG